MLNNLLSSYLFDQIEPIAKWVSIGVIGAMVISLIIIFFSKKENFSKPELIKTILRVIVFYAVIMGIILVTLEMLKKFSTGYLEDNWVSKKIIPFVFIPVLTTLILSLISMITIYFLSKRKATCLKTVKLIAGIVCAIAFITTIILIAVFYSNNILGDGYYTGDYGKLNSPILYALAFTLVAVVIILALVVGKNNKSPFDSKTISMAGVCISLAFVLSYVKFEAAWIQGGSITLVSFLPICLFSYVYGMKKGLIVGFIYGLLQAIQDPFIVHPAQFLLDYPIAFSMITLSGLLTDLNVLSSMPRVKFAIGALLTGTFRYIAHTISGVFAFGAYAADSGASSFLTYSAVYNTYVFIDIALVIVAGIILFSSKSFSKEMKKLSQDK